MEIGQAATFICDATLVQGGFYPPEQSPDGTAFRWIGPSPLATVFLPKPGTGMDADSTLNVTLHIYSAFVPEVLEEVQLALDGGPWVPAALCRDASGTRIAACLKPGPVAHLGAMRLDIDSVRTQSPKERGEMDERRLSLALSVISVATLQG